MTEDTQTPLPSIRTRLARGLNHRLAQRFGYIISPAVANASLAAEVSQFIDAFNIDHVLDVGAHWGLFGQHLRDRHRYQGRITSFEPSPDAFQVLSSVVADDPKWSCHNIALGSEEGEADFHQYNGHQGQFNSLRTLISGAEEYEPDLREIGSVRVNTRRLDALWSDLNLDGQQCLLKTDTQGFDLEVVHGTGGVLHQIPALLMEVAVRPLYEGAPTMADVIHTLSTQYSFEITGAFPIHRYHKNIRVIEFDCTFVNTQHVTATLDAS